MKNTTAAEPHVPTDGFGPLRTNLPSETIAAFIGRGLEQKQVVDAMTEKKHRIINLWGARGSGRSTLALRIAHSLTISETSVIPRFDAIVWVAVEQQYTRTLEKRDDIFRTEGVLYRDIADVLQYDLLHRIPHGDRFEAIKEILTENCCLLIFTDVDLQRDKYLIDFLGALPERSVAIVTSNESVKNWTLKVLDVELPALSYRESLHLLKSEAIFAGVELPNDEDDAAIASVVKQANGLPLALKWAVIRLRDSAQSLEAVTNLLSKGPEGLALAHMDKVLHGLESERKRILFALAQYPDPLEPGLLRELSCADQKTNFENSLNRLIESQLVAFDIASGHYLLAFRTLRKHILTQPLMTDSTGTIRHSTDVMLELAKEVCSTKNFNGNRRNLLRAFEHSRWLAKRTKLDDDRRRVVAFCTRLSDPLFERGFWNDAVYLGKIGFRTTNKLHDHERRAEIAMSPLGRIFFHQGKYEQAQKWLERSLGIYNTILGCDLQRVTLFRYLGRVYQGRGDLKTASTVFHEALDIANKCAATAGNVHDERAAELLVGHMHASIGGLCEARNDFNSAQKNYYSALEIYRRLEHQPGIGPTLSSLGGIAIQLEDFRGADELIVDAEQELSETGSLKQQAQHKLIKALLAKSNGEIDRAIELVDEALQDFRMIGARAQVDAAEVVRRRLLPDSDEGRDR